MADYPLGSLGLQIKAHWKQHRPQMYAELKKSGHLAESVYAAQERTSDRMDSLLAGGAVAPRGVGAGEGGVGVPPERGTMSPARARRALIVVQPSNAWHASSSWPERAWRCCGRAGGACSA